MTEQPRDRTYSDAVLEGLLRVVGEVVARAVGCLSPKEQEQALAVRHLLMIQCSPLSARLFLVSGPEDNVRELWRAGGADLPPALEEVVGGFVTAGLNRMEREPAKAALALVDRGRADICVMVEPGSMLARALLLPRGARLSDAMELFRLQAGEGEGESV